jgi:hypothetical protein
MFPLKAEGRYKAAGNMMMMMIIEGDWKIMNSDRTVASIPKFNLQV